MGVIMVGLLGVMAIIPLAGHRAQDAVSLSVAASLGDGAAKQLTSQRWFSTGRMAAWAGGNIGPFAGGEPFCIDPAFVSGEDHAANNQNADNGYVTEFFPFYRLNHDPTIDPSLGDMPPWPAGQPRLRRVGLRRADGTLMQLTEAMAVADSGDDLLVQRPKDRGLSVFRPGFQATELPAATSYGGRFATGEFSWIATVSPLDGGYVNLAVATIRNRERSFEVPALPVESPEGNAKDERLAYVSFAAGFSGGAGGTVHLLSSANTSARIRPGDWLMLSSHRLDGDGNVTALWHRWYRVAAVDGERGGDPELYEGTPNTLEPLIGVRLPGTAERRIWRHKLYLDGPDWPFGYQPTGFAGTDHPHHTFATLVEGVVSVSEHVLRMESL